MITGPQNPKPQSYPIVRRYVDMPGQKLTPQILQTNGNENDPFGTGGTCFGDSGGPLLLDGEIVGVTSYGYTSNCRYLGGYQRVDIEVVQDWLATFGVLGGISLAGNGLAILASPAAHQRVNPAQWVLTCLGVGALSQIVLATAPHPLMIATAALLARTRWR